MDIYGNEYIAAKQQSTITPYTSTLNTLSTPPPINSEISDNNVDVILKDCKFFNTDYNDATIIGGATLEKIDCGDDFNSNYVNNVDCNYFIYDMSSLIETQIPYINTDSTYMSTITSNIISNNINDVTIRNKRQNPCNAYIRYNNTIEILPLSTELQNIGVEISIISSMKNIDVIQDVLIVEHANGLFFNKIALDSKNKYTKASIEYKNFQICNPPAKSKHIHSSIQQIIKNCLNSNDSASDYICIQSRYFYVEKLNAVVFSLLYYFKNADFTTIEPQFIQNKNKDKDNTIPTNGDIIAPIIYMIYLDDLHYNIIYNGVYDTTYTHYCNIFKHILPPNLTKKIINIDTPIITFNSINNVFTLIYTFQNLCGLTYTYNMTFTYALNDITLMSNNLYTPIECEVELTNNPKISFTYKNIL